MAGLYTEGESKILSGVYSLILAISTSITSGGRGIVAYPFTADWGPVNELTTGNLRELRDNYNAVGSSLSVGKIYTHASNGEPKKVLGYRMATAEAKVAAATVDTWVFETVYPTTRPFVLVVKDGVEDGSIKISLVENAVELTSFLVSDVDSLVTMVNSGTKAKWKTKGTILQLTVPGVEPIEIDRNEELQDVAVTVDVSLNSGFTALEKGVGNWYVASVKIPAREYDYQPTGETDDEGYDILEEVALDVNMRDVTLCLWGIPDMTQAQKESEVK